MKLVAMTASQSGGLTHQSTRRPRRLPSQSCTLNMLPSRRERPQVEGLCIHGSAQKVLSCGLSRRSGTAFRCFLQSSSSTLGRTADSACYWRTIRRRLPSMMSKMSFRSTGSTCMSIKTSSSMSFVWLKLASVIRSFWCAASNFSSA